MHALIALYCHENYTALRMKYDYDCPADDSYSAAIHAERSVLK